MLQTLLQHSVRAFRRQKGYFLINILGLSIGIACSVMITLFVVHELSYDRYNKKGDHIFRVILNGKIGGQEITAVSTASVVGPTMVNDFPEVESFLRMSGSGGTVVWNGQESFIEDDFLLADSTFFNFFSIPVLRGDEKTVLNAPHYLVLSETTAGKIFGDEDPMGKTLRIGTDTVLYTITGIMEDIPENTHFTANMIGSFMTNPRADDPQWLSNSFSTYVQLKPNTDPDDVDAKIPDMIRKYVGPELERYLGASIDDFFTQGNLYNMYLQPLKECHLDPSVQQMLKPASNPKYLYIFGCIAILIVLIATINYMNLSTAQAFRRAREVGIKKVSGSSRGMLIKQFLAESVMMTLISLLLAILTVELTLPAFSNLLEVQLRVDYFGNWYTIPGLILLSLLIGFMAGSYPAFYLSQFRPIAVLKGNVKSGKKNGLLRSILVVFQFSVSIMLIIGTTVMYRQIQFLLKRDLGFDQENLMVINRVGALGNQSMAFMEIVREIPGVESASLSTAVPARNNNTNGYLIEGRGDESFLMTTNWTDYDFLRTFNMKTVLGRGFDRTFSTDTEACILNESAVKQFNLKDPLNVRIMVPDAGDQITPAQVIGVVKDFHHESLHSPIQPYIIRFRPEAFRFGYISIKISPDQMDLALPEIERSWKEFTGNDPLQYFFMEEEFARQYREERQNATLAVLFSILAILIASLGLFGLTSYTLAQRTKEIGVRRVMGASVGRIFYIISKETVVLVLFSTLIAWPLIFFVARNWLENFYYRINLTVSDFFLGFILALLIALVTISYRTVKSARANPVEALSTE